MAILLAAFGLFVLAAADAPGAAAPTSPLAVATPTPEPVVVGLTPQLYANLVTTRMGGLTPEEIALLMSMLDDNGDGELTCAHTSRILARRLPFFTPCYWPALTW